MRKVQRKKNANTLKLKKIKRIKFTPFLYFVSMNLENNPYLNTICKLYTQIDLHHIDPQKIMLRFCFFYKKFL